MTLWLSVVAPGSIVSDPEAQRLVQEAQEAFVNEDFERSAELVEQAYLIEPEPALLYMWAQAERSRENCEVAIELYERFLDSDPPEKLAEYALDNISRCEEILAQAPPPVVVQEPPPVDEDPQPVETLEPEPQDDVEPPRPWYLDPLGGGLAGGGIVGVAVGGALMGVARGRADDASSQELQSDYEDAKARASRLNGGGIAMLSIGGALLVGASVRYVLVAKQNRAKTARISIAPSLTGLSISGRF